ncbi:MAG: hypothetical protein K9L70_12600 [Thiohalocapsa sp.]|nr:hypothetical protein [Thiohalocapsa sp.]
MNAGFLARSATMLLVLVIAGCETTPTISEVTDVEELLRLAEAGAWSTVASAHIQCDDRTERCAKAHATKGDACLRLAIQQPLAQTSQNTSVRRLLDCAEDSYLKALQIQPDPNVSSRVSYHGGLLLTLSERRNRLTDLTRAEALRRENEKLLTAAQTARRETPDSALGFLYGASAHVFRAASKPRGELRCPDLRRPDDLLERSPPPPRELSSEEERIRSLTKVQLRSNGCNARR